MATAMKPSADKNIPHAEDNLGVDYQYDNQGRLKDEVGYDLSEAEPRTPVYERHYEYDDASNRTSMRLVNRQSSDVTWHFLIDDRNRMWGRYVGNDWDDATKRWWYDYDDNGNLTVAMYQLKEEGTWQEQNRWYYTWNTRDELTRVEKYAYGGNTLVLGEEYRYSLAGSGERTERIYYAGNDHYIMAWYRYENDGLLTYRVDEKYDADQNDIDEADPWRVREKRTHGPGLVGNLISKEVLEYASRYSADNAESRVYFYDYDAQGNVALVTEQYCTGSTYKYVFHQDAFGNQLGGAQGFQSYGWFDASEEGVTEHQTGKEYDIRTGLYYFNHRWYDPVVGRYISRTPLPPYAEGSYLYCENNPINRIDPDGLEVGEPGFCESLIPVWGSGRTAINDFQTGHPFWGTFDAALAISDTCLVKSLIEGAGKGIWKTGAHSWTRTKAWYAENRQLVPRTPVHHWLIKQESSIGNRVPNWIKHQPWNLMPMPSQTFHNYVHSCEKQYLSQIELVWYGTPDWYKSGLISTAGRAIESIDDTLGDFYCDNDSISSFGD
jgi:RHS repeat-associated protein